MHACERQKSRGLRVPVDRLALKVDERVDVHELQQRRVALGRVEARRQRESGASRGLRVLLALAPDGLRMAMGADMCIDMRMS